MGLSLFPHTCFALGCPYENQLCTQIMFERVPRVVLGVEPNRPAPSEHYKTVMLNDYVAYGVKRFVIETR